MVQVKDKRGQTARVDEEILRRFQVDFRGVGLGAPERWRDRWLDERPRGRVGRRPDHAHGLLLFRPGRLPVGGDGSLSALERTAGRTNEPGRFRGLRKRAQHLHRETDYAVMVDLNCAFFLRCCELRGWENFYMDIAANAPFAEALMDRFLEIRLDIAERALDEVGEDVDIVMVTSDDLGGTDRPLISPALYRSLIKPRQQRTFDFFRARTGAKLYYHTDGAIYPLLPDFVDLGVEMLNPVQCPRTGWATREAQARVRRQLTFWGAIDTHQVLPLGTPAEVRGEVRRRIRDLGPGGGYVVARSTTSSPRCPPRTSSRCSRAPTSWAAIAPTRITRSSSTAVMAEFEISAEIGNAGSARRSADRRNGGDDRYGRKEVP